MFRWSFDGDTLTTLKQLTNRKEYKTMKKKTSSLTAKLGSRQHNEPMKYQTGFGRKSIILSMIYSMLIGGSVLAELRTSLAADVFPTPPAPEKREDVPSPGSALPPEKRPSIDPGIVIPPPAEPHPDSVVDPPIIDPDMSIHPQDAPTTNKPSRPTPLPSEPPEKSAPK